MSLLRRLLDLLPLPGTVCEDDAAWECARCHAPWAGGFFAAPNCSNSRCTSRTRMLSEEKPEPPQIKRPDCTCLAEHYGACPKVTPSYTRQEEESLRVLYHVVKKLSDPALVRYMDEFDRDALRIGREYLQDKEWWD